MSGVHGHIDQTNKKVALLIAVLALFLAISETLGKSAQTSAISSNIEASNLWAFFQAKTIRVTVLKTAADGYEANLPGIDNKKVLEMMGARVADWRASVARYESEPETGEGRKELATRARTAELKRDNSLSAYHYFELSSAVAQIAIVLASASVITGAVWLTWIASGLGVAGLILCSIGMFWPIALHLA
jgi:hypothetical protein